MNDLSVIILTKNEELNIRKCIESIRNVAKRIIVVDSFSSDATEEIAKELECDVFKHKFINHADQFNWALSNCNIDTTWVMKLDADEYILPELANEINSKLNGLDNNVNGIILRRRVMFMGKWLKHGGKYPELLLRIFRFGHGMSENKEMDEHLIIDDGLAVEFKNDFVDDNKKNITEWIDKHNWYSDKEVKERKRLQTENDSKNIDHTSGQAKIKRILKNYGYYSLPKFFRAHLYFIYRYYFRFGFLDGTEGRIYTFLQAYWYRYLVDAKMFEQEKRSIEK